MTELETIVTQWEGYRPGHIASETDVAQLLAAAELAADDHPSIWPRAEAVLNAHGGLADDKAAKREIRRCRITADLGSYPWTAEEYVAAFMRSRSLSLKFSGEFADRRQMRGANYIANQMKLHFAISAYRTFAQHDIDAAFQNWQEDERARVLARGFDHVAFDPHVDPKRSELAKFAALITADPARVPATEIAFANLIHRAKNHMRQRWSHGTHLMPVLFGPQGSGKTTALQYLSRPIADFTMVASFDILNHDAKQYELSVMPLIIFDELSKLRDDDLATVKAIMTDETRPMRKLYQNPEIRRVVSTFSGCTNRDLSSQFKDETGNRRFLQIETPAKIARTDLAAIDFLKVWRSVDEDADAPLYADAAALEAVQAIQAQQRYLSVVERWLDDCPDIPVAPSKASALFRESFYPWLQEMAPGEAKAVRITEQFLGIELTRIAGDPAYGGIVTKTTSGSAGVRYRVTSTSRTPSYPMMTKLAQVKP